jgi:RHS repeat-associated protein
VQTYNYDSFGNITPSGGINQPYTYTAREYDNETGLYYYRARYYDPKAGRFITRDPISFAGGDGNLYGYVENNPINFVDPFGLINLGKTATGFLSMTDGVTMVGYGVAATVGTAILTKNPYLTAAVGANMALGVVVGLWDINHGAHTFWEGLWEQGEKAPCR